jgi:pyruvate dehydrogenase E2 component (dihydrolipoamide acetyltransferase)
MAKIIEMPKLGFDMAEGTLVNWTKAEGDKIEKGEVLADIETDKATVQVESSEAGILFKQLVQANTTLPIGEPIAVIAAADEDVDLDKLLAKQPAEAEKQEEAEQKSEKQPNQVKAEQQSTQTRSDDLIKASPVAKHMAAQHSLDLSQIKGSGPGGRIVKRDVEKALEVGKISTDRRQAAQIIPGRDQKVPLSKLRTAIGKRMQDSNQNIPVFTITSNYRFEKLLEMRKQMNEGLSDENKLSVNDFIVRATSLALRQYPNLNASLGENEIIRYGNINIGVAVSLESGLLTVVVKNADQKPLAQISQETREMAARARSGKLRNEDIEGSTFTISNLGMYNVEDFTAIINPPEAAILAVGRAQETPVVENGRLSVGWRMKATISADHRITDGAEAAQFMQHLGIYIEQPWRLV